MNTGNPDNPDWQIARRKILQAGAAAALFLPLPHAWVWAQSEGMLKLIKAPKFALVIGNSKYRSLPELINPANDATAIAEALRQCGFAATVKLDSTRSEMAAAMQAHVRQLAEKQAVGLIYFAGHGIQLAWRNYLIPVDAAVRRIDDILLSCIDLTGLMESFGKASNPMNVVILDACRNNPFEGVIPTDHRGLSQMDAPPGTLLAYATAPGNVASDGEGAYGIYTENLLREMRVAGAKIEDVFKRVRLHVRKRTNGRQIPWESTSLEEDFYFVPPRLPLPAAGPAMDGPMRAVIRTVPVAMMSEERLAISLTQTDENPFILAQSGRGRQRQAPQDNRPSGDTEDTAAEDDPVTAQFVEEQTLWEHIQSAVDPAPFEDYLLRYPSGHYAELAQLQYDSLMTRRGEKRISVINDDKNPYTKGSAFANTRFQAGDSYTYRELELYSRAETGRVTETVTRVTASRVEYSSGLVTDLLGNQLRRRGLGGYRHLGIQATPLEYAVGKRWKSRYLMPAGGGRPGGSHRGEAVEMEFRILTREQVTVTAGTFYAFHIQGIGWSRGDKHERKSEVHVWHAPHQLRRPLIVEHLRFAYRKKVSLADRRELVAFKES